MDGPRGFLLWDLVSGGGTPLTAPASVGFASGIGTTIRLACSRGFRDFVRLGVGCGWCGHRCHIFGLPGCAPQSAFPLIGLGFNLILHLGLGPMSEWKRSAWSDPRQQNIAWGRIRILAPRGSVDNFWGGSSCRRHFGRVG